MSNGKIQGKFSENGGMIASPALFLSFPSFSFFSFFLLIVRTCMGMGYLTETNSPAYWKLWNGLSVSMNSSFGSDEYEM